MVVEEDCGEEREEEESETEEDQPDTNSKEGPDQHYLEKEDQRSSTWLGVGEQSWTKVMEGKAMKMKTSGKLVRRLWLFGDSILKGVGREVHFLCKGYYKIMDRIEGGANIERIREIIEEHLAQINPEDLVVIGGGNGLMNVGEQETITVISEMMKLKEKVQTNPLIMCIPMRRRVERTVYGEKRRKLNRKCIENLESWGCDGLHLWENMK